MPDWRSLRNARASPQAVLRQLGMLKPPIDVERIATAIGARVLRTTDPAPDWSGALDYPGGEPVIWVRHTERVVYQRFTIAHELGHLLLHPVGMYRDISYMGSAVERDANRFACGLLMPPPLLATLAGGHSVGELVEVFDVTPAALKCWAGRLGYVAG